MADKGAPGQGPGPRLGNLALRSATAAVGIPLFLAALWIGGWLLCALTLALAIIAFLEFARLWQRRGVGLAPASGSAGVAALVLWAQFTAGDGGSTAGAALLGAIITGFLLCTLTWQVLRHPRLTAEGALLTVAGVFYTGWLFAHLLLLRGFSPPAAPPAPALLGWPLPWGFALVLLALLLTWATDTGAYFVGRAVGGPKLAPQVSPAKTVSGAVGGTLLAVLVGAGLGQWLQLGPWPGAGLGLGVALAGQVGDLAESALKRHVGVKDSGALLPGHGGVLDRFDSTLFTVPVVFYVLRFLMQ